MTRADLVWGGAGLAFTLIAAIVLLAGRYDRRLLDGAAVWSKPFKFALSLAMYLFTFAVIAQWLPAGYRDGPWLSTTAIASVVGGFAELAYIIVQAARGRHSHFNRDTRLEAIAFSLMGAGAVLMLAPALVVGFALLAFPPQTWPWAVTVGTATALLGGAALTLITASRMGAVGSHFADGKQVSERKVWLTGWSLDGADLRPAHFLATHMMQAVPIVSIVASETMPQSAALAVSVLFALAWTILTLGLFRYTLAGGSLASILGLAAAD